MATIGNFSKNGDGYNGALQTLTFNVKIKLVPATKEGDNTPDYRVLAGTMEIGAAWKRQSAASKPYLSVKLDDPSLPAPINARLIDLEGGNAMLYWTRRNGD